MPNVGLVFSARDNVSGTMAKIRSSCQYFNKDLDGLQQRLDHFNKTKVDIKMDMSKAKNELKSLQKEFDKTGDAATGEKLKEALLDYEKMSQNLKMVEKAASQTRNEMVKLGDEVSRTSNRTGGIGGAGGSGQGMLSKIASAGATQMLGDLAGKAIGTYISSAMGSAAGQMTSSILSYGASGAAIGSMIAPGIGTAIGAAAGGIAGAVSGAMDIYAEQDEAFKSVVQENYNTALQAREDAKTSGSQIASNREQKRISFSTLLGSDEAADEYLGQMTDFAAKTPFGYDQLANMSKTLLAYGYKEDELLPLLTKVGDAGSALGMSGEDMNYVATYLGRMNNTGKTTLEYLNPLLERGIPVFDYLADASGKTNAEVQEMISKGMIPGAEAAKIIADYMGEDFAGNMEKQAQTFAGLTSTLEDATDELNNAMGKGYNDTRKKGIQDQIEYLEGDTGQAMQEAYKKIGEFQASIENKGEEIQRDMMGAIVNGVVPTEFLSKYGKETVEELSKMINEYAEAEASGTEEAGAKMGEILSKAQIMAVNRYHADEGYQLLQQSNLSLAEGIRQDTALQGEYWNAGYQMGQQFSKGMASGISSAGSRGEINSAIKSNKPFVNEATGNIVTPNGQIDPVTGNVLSFAPGKAFGLPYVPYDNYPALLHQGERVLTASEARGYQNTPNVNISGNFTVREEADIGKIAKAFVHEIMLANMVS